MSPTGQLGSAIDAPTPPHGDADARRPAAMDALELELRQVHGVAYVSFTDRRAATVIEIATHLGVDEEEVRVESRRLAVRHLDGPVEVEVLSGEGSSLVERTGTRVRLLLALRPSDDDRVELHLAQGDRRAVVEATGSDPVDIASQVLRALEELGLPTPFVVESVHDLTPELGAGSLVILRHPLSGHRRRGLAEGSNSAEAHARAVLDALNRYLQPSRSVG